MWYLKELEIDGLMSFGENAKISFNQGEVSIIYGRNLDAGEDKSNGSGKSAILEGIGFGITGSPLRKVKIGELVNDDRKDAFVKVVLGNDGLGEEMIIERIAYRKKSSVCQVFINGEQITELTSTDDANKYIAGKIGIVKEDLLNFFILMASQFTPFLDASDTKKKEVINRFSNGVLVDNAIEALEADMELCKEEFTETQQSCRSLELTLTTLQSTLKETLEKKDEDTPVDEEIKQIKQLIKSKEKNVVEIEEELGFLSEDLKDVEEEIDEMPDTSELDSKRDEAKVKMDECKSELSSLKAEINQNKHRISHLKVQMDGSVSCPKCDYEFDPSDENFSMSDARNEIERLSQLNGTLTENGVAGRKVYDTLSETVDSLNSRIKKVTDKRKSLQREKNGIENDISENTIKLKANKSKIESLNIKIDALSSKEEVDAVTPLKNKIKSVEAKYEPLSEKLADLEAEMNDFTVQLDVFKRFKSHLANLSLKSMEALANDFLEDFGSDIFLELNAEKKLANGKTKEKIDAALVRNGVDIGSFNKRSGGEKAAINLAFAKTLSHLINLNAGENRGFNLLVVDEILDATDQEGLQKIVRAFEKSDATVVMISHIPLPDSVGRHITVCKENDLSRIV
jgi:exonuclease SbcC